jgi:hypothetical protein
VVCKPIALQSVCSFVPGTISAAMAEEQQQSLQEQLEGIGAQLDWVRGYL